MSRRYLQNTFLFLSAVFFLVLGSCADIRRSIVDYPPPPPPPQKIEPERYLTKGEYQKALDLYRLIYYDNPKDPVLTHKYIKTIESIKKDANIAFDKDDLSLAGRIYKILLGNYQHFSNFEHMLSFDTVFLNHRLDECSKTLFTRGLEQYRKGNIEDAISLWESQLIFEPDNAEVIKAIETARIQLINLQEKK
jgi:tetratricopeptide (TPR) repeat protein